MIRLQVEVVLSGRFDGNGAFVREETSETVVESVELDCFDPEILNNVIPGLLSSTVKAVGGTGPASLLPFTPEIVVALFADEGEARPALHLNHKTLTLLCNAGAAFDFDPYTYS